MKTLADIFHRVISMSMGRGGMMFLMVYVYINKVEGIFSLTVRRRIMVQVLILCVVGNSVYELSVLYMCFKTVILSTTCDTV